jgi:hypothetical protein
MIDLNYSYTVYIIDIYIDSSYVVLIYRFDNKIFKILINFNETHTKMRLKMEKKAPEIIITSLKHPLLILPS